jgi:hypothetical protein
VWAIMNIIHLTIYLCSFAMQLDFQHFCSPLLSEQHNRDLKNIDQAAGIRAVKIDSSETQCEIPGP